MIADGFAQMVRIEREQMQLREEHDVLEERHDQLEQKHEALEVKVETIIEDRDKAVEELSGIQIADELPAPKTTRAKINELVRAYAHAKNIQQSGVWTRLYHELKYRNHIDVMARKRKQDKKSYLDIIEEAGYLDELYKIASSYCQIKNR
jgi:hypothetical protein